MDIKSRLRNYGLWVSLFALIGLALDAFGVAYVPAEYERIVNIILAIGVGAGILNNPTTDARGFGDD